MGLFGFWMESLSDLEKGTVYREVTGNELMDASG